MLDGLFSLTPNMIAWHGIFEMLDELTPVLIYKGDSSNQPAMRTARSVVVCRFAFRPKFARVVSFCSRHTSRRPLFTNETRLMKSAMRRARRSEENLPLTFLRCITLNITVHSDEPP
ncbi:SPRY domain-containing SOCS box protein 1 [Trichinella spiralis]|uniref:SPRY domain-containing SOCS box protein 1 n=1 Tax=Trichinella spiralis TaxID=6334 RepID=UPI0001EFEEAA|nr:SPRY domain-containing SOCS box protein 1 [Trichinella spiralis]